MSTWPALIVGLTAIGAVGWGSVPAGARQTAAATAQANVAELWQDPDAQPARDLFAGPGGTELQPDASVPFAFVAVKTGGTSPGYDVRDASGRDWSVKLGPEAQSEVTVSRLLWAMGFHQPPTYYLPQWTLTGEEAGVKSGGRFRPEDGAWKPSDEWSWYENPFVDTPAFRGLVVAQMIVANWDLKTSNNRVYEVASASSPPRRFVVRDLGASLGSARQHPFFALLGTRGQQGTKNDLAGFEKRGFITGVEGRRVEFDYRGLNEELFDIVTPEDVMWACALLARLDDRQWGDAFRAGGYTPEVSARFIAKLKEKVAQGLALRSSTSSGANAR